MLGVLDVTVSLDEVDQQIVASRNRIVGLAVGAVAVAGLLLWWLSRRLVSRPVAALTAGTRRVAAGDLTTTIPVNSRNELGELARAFNTMTARLVRGSASAHAGRQARLGRPSRRRRGARDQQPAHRRADLCVVPPRSRPRATPSCARDLEVIVRETKRCREIVRGLLDFARQTPPRRQPTDLNDVARRAVAVVMNQLQLGHVALTLDLADDLPAVEADPNQMQQVVVNLLLNAADALGERGGTIRLASRQAQLLSRAAMSPSGAPPARTDATSSIRARASAACRRSVSSVSTGDASGGSASTRCTAASTTSRPSPARRGWWRAAACPRCRTTLVEPDSACERCGAPTFAVLGPDDEPIRWCTRTGCHFTWWEAREHRGPVPVVELSVEDNGRGIAREDLAEALRALLHDQGGARHRARARDHVGHRREPRRDDRGREREGRRQPFHRAPAARRGATLRRRGMTDCDVLVIDDEPVVRAAVRRVLEANGLRVATAEDAASGLGHPALATCRLVLCDLMLPDRSGTEVLSRACRRRPDLPVVMITGYRDARPRRARARGGRRRLPRQAVRGDGS